MNHMQISLKLKCIKLKKAQSEYSDYANTEFLIYLSFGMFGNTLLYLINIVCIWF